ncbi:long-chain-fatty-acid--CoA ligase [Cytobacillus purgationiresistens]|uniref:Long-chain acyl-CoA synthetase n=1 Tax=Cytobacillus purgationiresistens TaxID=863449 RepID=A0ABU0AGM4_9BACI|nr:long-chain fatty acid--CoA ligase [Cytobacillus purgationiresistens]MDQ0270416.1 long-chain acyl-CoA synthetase [Cytobacillus purgationiresistens]
MSTTPQTKVWEEYYEDIIDTFNIPEISLYEMFDQAANRFGNQTATIFKDETLSYKELKRRIDGLAAEWVEKGYKKGDRIGLMLANHPDYITAYYAAQALGAIVVQMNPSYTAREVLQILHDTQINYVVADAKSIDTVRQIKELYSFQHITLSTTVGEEATIHNASKMSEVFMNAKPLQASAKVDSVEDVAVIQYTGGTSGKVKGAMLTHHNLVANVYQSYVLYRQRVEFGRETVLAATPFYHVYAMTSAMNLGIYLGARILIIEKFQVDDVLRQVKEYRPTMFPGVPKMYISFVNHPDAGVSGLNSLKVCSSGSAPLPIEIIKKFKEITGSNILEGFGMSETSPTTHRTPINGKHKHGSIGIPVPATDCRIVDKEHHFLGPNQVGELLIKGPQVMKGYWNKPEETAENLKDGWLYTGDLATMDDEGYFYIVGRKKEMIIFGGFNVYPQEVEGVLYEHPSIQEAAVVGLPDAESGEIAKAFIVAKEGTELDLEEIRAYCYTKLTPYKVPRLFEKIDQLPRNGVGKLLKRLLVKDEMEKRGVHNGESTN